MLQYNEQKYFQYEKVLRELILNKNTDEAVKDHLREKIESQELFVPKDERKVSNLVIDNQEKGDVIRQLRSENVKLQTQLEEITEKAQTLKQNLAKKPAENNEEPVLEFLNNTMEQMTIFQNKDIGAYRNIRLSKIQREGADDFSDSDSGENKDGINRKYVKKLEITIENLNGKLTKAKKELEKIK